MTPLLPYSILSDRQQSTSETVLGISEIFPELVRQIEQSKENVLRMDEKGYASMTVKDLVDRLDLQVVAGQDGLDSQVEDGYCGDLLSDIMANAPQGCIWLTIQGHPSTVAVAVLCEMAAIIVTGGQTPDGETLLKANAEKIPILLWLDSAYQLAGRLFAMGVGKP